MGKGKDRMRLDRDTIGGKTRAEVERKKAKERKRGGTGGEQD